METINKEKAKELINESNGRIFSSVFIKKDGTHRLMNARTKVKKHLKKDAKPRAWKPGKYNLIQVYDMQSKNYRMINVNTLQTLILNKKIYNIK
tara:strand:- start:404 stop:685 length:282 start_codon:yes stop_codon:yes gene_type:complete